MMMHLSHVVLLCGCEHQERTSGNMYLASMSEACHQGLHCSTRSASSLATSVCQSLQHTDCMGAHKALYVNTWHDAQQ